MDKRRRRRRRRRKMIPKVGPAVLTLLALILTTVVSMRCIRADDGCQAGEPGIEKKAVEMTALECIAKKSAMTADGLSTDEEVEQEEKDLMERKIIEAALVESGYFRDDVPLSYELQDCLHTACQEAGIPYALALAVIEKETHFQNIVGDDGASEGYMQVQRKWHYDRMERLGVTDLSDPFGNFRVGCDLLAELLRKYTMQEALTAYNTGSPGYNRYSYQVMENYERWKELVGDDVSGIKG